MPNIDAELEKLADKLKDPGFMKDFVANAASALQNARIDEGTVAPVVAELRNWSEQELHLLARLQKAVKGSGASDPIGMRMV